MLAQLLFELAVFTRLPALGFEHQAISQPIGINIGNAGNRQWVVDYVYSFHARIPLGTLYRLPFRTATREMSELVCKLRVFACAWE